MKYLFFLLFVSTLTLSQSQNSGNLLIDRAPCTFEMTIEELTGENLKFKCDELFDNNEFGVENFRIKFKGNASIPVVGNSLNEQSQILAKKSKTGDIVVVFMVENLIINGGKSQEYKTLDIKIVEP